MKRKVLAIVTAACLVLSMIPSMAFATWTDGNNKVWGDDCYGDTSYSSEQTSHSSGGYCSDGPSYQAIIKTKDGGEVYYHSLSNAIGTLGVKDNEFVIPADTTFTINSNASIPGGTSINISVEGELIIEKDVKIELGNSYIYVNGGKLNVAGELSANYDAIIINGGEVNISGKVTAGYDAIVASTKLIKDRSGKKTETEAAKAFKLNIAGTEDSPAYISGSNLGLFLANKLGTTSISGYATLIAKTPVWANAGALNIDSSKGNIAIIGDCDNVFSEKIFDKSDYNPYSASLIDDATATGDAIVVEKNGTNPVVKISGENNNLVVASISLMNVESNSPRFGGVANVNRAVAVYPDGQKAKFISAGLYSTDVSEYLLPGYGVKQYNVKSIEFGDNWKLSEQINGEKLKAELIRDGITSMYKVTSAKTDLSSAKVVLSEYVELFQKNGTTKQPAVKVYLDGKELKQFDPTKEADTPERDCDYKVSYEADQSVGRAKVIIEATDLGNYTGKKVAYYYVKGKLTTENLKNTVVNDNKSLKYTVKVIGSKFVYCGQQIKPFVLVKIGSLIANPSEYNVTYSENTDAGTATVKVTSKATVNANAEGTPKYEGTANFEILKKTLKIIPDSITKTEIKNEEIKDNYLDIETEVIKEINIRESFLRPEISGANAVSFTSSFYGGASNDKAVIQNFIDYYLEYFITDKDNKPVDVISNGYAIDYSGLKAGIYNINLNYDNVGFSGVSEAYAEFIKVLNNYNIDISTPGKLIILDEDGNLVGADNNTQIKSLYQSLLEKYNKNPQSITNKLAAAMNGSETYYEGILKAAEKIKSYWAKLPVCNCK